MLNLRCTHACEHRCPRRKLQSFLPLVMLRPAPNGSTTCSYIPHVGFKSWCVARLLLAHHPPVGRTPLLVLCVGACPPDLFKRRLKTPTKSLSSTLAANFVFTFALGPTHVLRPQVYCSGESGGFSSPELGGSRVFIEGGTFVGNKALEVGGAVMIWGPPTVVTITGGIFEKNYAT